MDSKSELAGESNLSPLAPHKPSWKNRRRTIFATLGFCAVLVAYLATFGDDSRLNETLATGAFGLAGFVVAGYVFGAVAEDVGLFRGRK